MQFRRPICDKCHRKNYCGTCGQVRDFFLFLSYPFFISILTLFLKKIKINRKKKARDGAVEQIPAEGQEHVENYSNSTDSELSVASSIMDTTEDNDNGEQVDDATEQIANVRF